MKLKVTVCIGSSCHLKGSRQVVQSLREMIEDNDVADKVDIAGTFCLGQCQKGVCVTIGDDFFSVSPETVEEFFTNEIMKRIA
ncbi:MAG: (2Fe-2S) ferredoxin domain-containing protein [Clostridia bacterium]|nr:(2Fe-2S) ferredoxin domain-containing protein [Clostridia bacterium]